MGLEVAEIDKGVERGQSKIVLCSNIFKVASWKGTNGKNRNLILYSFGERDIFETFEAGVNLTKKLIFIKVEHDHNFLHFAPNSRSKNLKRSNNQALELDA